MGEHDECGCRLDSAGLVQYLRLPGGNLSISETLNLSLAAGARVALSSNATVRYPTLSIDGTSGDVTAEAESAKGGRPRGATGLGLGAQIVALRRWGPRRGPAWWSILQEIRSVPERA